MTKLNRCLAGLALLAAALAGGCRSSDHGCAPCGQGNVTYPAATSNHAPPANGGTVIQAQPR